MSVDPKSDRNVLNQRRNPSGVYFFTLCFYTYYFFAYNFYTDNFFNLLKSAGGRRGVDDRRAASRTTQGAWG
jgi:hypothetical protein